MHGWRKTIGRQVWEYSMRKLTMVYNDSMRISLRIPPFLRAFSITGTHNPFLDSESRFTGLVNCNWMYIPKTDCTLNMVTVTFLLQHQFNNDEEVYDPKCINYPWSYWKLWKMWDNADRGNLTKSDTLRHNWTDNHNPDFDFG